MGWGSCDVKFDLGPLLQGQRRTAKLKSAYYSFITGPRGFQCETKLWEIMDRNLLIPEITLGPSFKVK